MAVLETTPVAPEKPDEFTPVELPDIQMKPSTRRKLQKARELIANGWVKGEFRVRAGECISSYKSITAHRKLRYARVDRYCVIGALREAGAGWKSEPAQLFAQVAGLDSAGYIPNWNDARGRKKSHVLAVFDELLAE